MDKHEAGPALDVMRLLQSLDDAVGLHEEIEIIYVVDGYNAALFARDGQRIRQTGHGKTIVDAMTKLAAALQAAATKGVENG